MTALVAVGRKPMTYRELTMIDVREVLRRWAEGHSNRQIARETGADSRNGRAVRQRSPRGGANAGHGRHADRR